MKRIQRSKSQMLLLAFSLLGVAIAILLNEQSPL